MSKWNLPILRNKNLYVDFERECLLKKSWEAFILKGFMHFAGFFVFLDIGRQLWYDMDIGLWLFSSACRLVSFALTNCFGDLVESAFVTVFRLVTKTDASASSYFQEETL